MNAEYVRPPVDITESIRGEERETIEEEDIQDSNLLFQKRVSQTISQCQLEHVPGYDNVRTLKLKVKEENDKGLKGNNI
jgi:hypothetical protein